MQVFVSAYALGVMESDVGGNGKWFRRTLVGQTLGDNPKLIAFDVFGKKRCEQLDSIISGSMLKVHYTIDAHEYDGKWYNRINLERVEIYTSVPKNTEQ